MRQLDLLAAFNHGGGNDITQNIDCFFVSIGCLNNSAGDGNDQNLMCFRSAQCTNNSTLGISGNTQKSICINSGTCQNDGTDTTVISVKTSNCNNGDASGSTTICVNNRIINRPSS